jgi:ribonuclease HII
MSILIGVDEAGRGPVLGPLVVAGVKLDSEAQNAELTKLGVRDSKQVTPKRRQWLSDELKKKFKFSLKVKPAKLIDEQRKKSTLNKLEGTWFAEVISDLHPDENTVIYVDSADVSEERFAQYIKSDLTSHPTIISKHKADENYPIVAAASILAKVERDSQIEKIQSELNAELGSGYPSDPITIQFLENWIKEKGNLPPYTRHSWKTAHRLLNKYKTPVKTLDKF